MVSIAERKVSTLASKTLMPVSFPSGKIPAPVHQDIEPTELGHDEQAQALDACGIGNIEGMAGHIQSLLNQLLSGCFSFRGPVTMATFLSAFMGFSDESFCWVFG